MIEGSQTAFRTIPIIELSRQDFRPLMALSQ